MRNLAIDRSLNSSDENGPSEMLKMAFVTAYLLTGNVEASQAAIEDAIQEWEPSLGEMELLRHTAAIALTHRSERPDDFAVPARLRYVIDLPTPMRQCFILRCLLGLTTSATGRLLLISKGDVDRQMVAAMQSLADRSRELRQMEAK